MGSESIAHEAEGRMGYRLRGLEGERDKCFSKIRLVGQKYPEYKNFSYLKLDSFAAKKRTLFATSRL